MLNEPPIRPAPSSPQGGSGAGAAAAQGLPQPPPGMSVYAVKRVIGEAQWSPEQLEQVRLLRKRVGGYFYKWEISSCLSSVYTNNYLKNEWIKHFLWHFLSNSSLCNLFSVLFAV